MYYRMKERPEIRYLLVNGWKEEGVQSSSRLGTISFLVLDLPSSRRIVVRTKDVMECQGHCKNAVFIQTPDVSLSHFVLCDECHGETEGFKAHRAKITERAKAMFPELLIVDSAEQLRECLAQHKNDSKVWDVDCHGRMLTVTR